MTASSGQPGPVALGRSDTDSFGMAIELSGGGGTTETNACSGRCYPQPASVGAPACEGGGDCKRAEKMLTLLDETLLPSLVA